MLSTCYIIPAWLDLLCKKNKPGPVQDRGNPPPPTLTVLTCLWLVDSGYRIFGQGQLDSVSLAVYIKELGPTSEGRQSTHGPYNSKGEAGLELAIPENSSCSPCFCLSLFVSVISLCLSFSLSPYLCLWLCPSMFLSLSTDQECLKWLPSFWLPSGAASSVSTSLSCNHPPSRAVCLPSSIPLSWPW